jgi:SAM-dependent methyltransferase
MRRSPRAVWVEEQVDRLSPGARVLDVGFVGAHGEPVLNARLRERRPDLSWVGLDLNVEALVRYRVPRSVGGDGARLPFRDGSFDAVLFLEVLEHVLEEGRFLGEIRRVLAPGGALVLTTPNAWSVQRIARWWLPGSLVSRARPEVVRGYLGAGDHVRFLDPLSLVSILGEHGFDVVAIATRNHRIPGLARLWGRFGAVDLRFWPLDRLGGYLCVVARRASRD